MNCSNIAIMVGQYDSEKLYNYVLVHNPDVDPNNVKAFVAINNNDLVISYKDGKRELFDTFEDKREWIEYQTDAMTELQHRKQFPKQLRKIMRRRFVDQIWLSNETGISQPTISRYLAGTAIPGYARLKKIAIALNCAVDDLYLNIPIA